MPSINRLAMIELQAIQRRFRERTGFREMSTPGRKLTLRGPVAGMRSPETKMPTRFQGPGGGDGDELVGRRRLRRASRRECAEAQKHGVDGAGGMRQGLAFWVIVSETGITDSAMVAQIWKGLADE
jgi:hypothetical protein